MSPKAIALPLPINGNLPILRLRFLDLACISVIPIEATCGLQYVHPGIDVLSIGFKFL